MFLRCKGSCLDLFAKTQLNISQDWEGILAMRSALDAWAPFCRGKFMPYQLLAKKKKEWRGSFPRSFFRISARVGRKITIAKGPISLVLCWGVNKWGTLIKLMTWSNNSGWSTTWDFLSKIRGGDVCTFTERPLKTLKYEGKCLERSKL